MKRFANRGLALLMAVLLCFSLLTVTTPQAQAASNYVSNWGSRGETATELSESAVAFYTGNNTYANLAQLPGGTSQSNAPSSALFKALQQLMEDAHSYKTSYNATRDLYQYTDCQKGSGAISSFYSGKSIGPAWDSGKTWNREHVWPNSKSDSGSKGETTRECDIMMLRPTASSENGSRSNTAYGESDGYYYPNTESGGSFDVRGDAARTVLYVYVRWGGDAENDDGALDYMWGSSGVIESLDVLLKWIKEDPVDTWELGRNDSVESITGTRNVFVDYPELAFLLFNEEIPADMATPSNGKDATGHIHSYDNGVKTAPTCKAQGYTTYTCTASDCDYSFKTDYTDKAGHSFTDGVCTVCGTSENAGDSTGDSVNGSVTVLISDLANANSWTDTTKYTSFALNDVVTVTASDGNYNGAYYVNGNNWRIYQADNGTFTISAEGTTISSVKITYVKYNTGILTYNGVNVDSGEIVNVNAASATFGVGNTGDATNGQARITAIEVAYGTGSIGGDDNTGGDSGNTGGDSGNTGGAIVETKTVKIYYPDGGTYVTSAPADRNRLAAGSSEEEATVWTAEIDENGYYIFSSEGKYMTSGATGNSLSMEDTLTDCARWEVIECTGGVYLRNVGAAYNGTYNQYMEFYYDFTTYGFNESKANIYTFQLVEVASAPSEPEVKNGLHEDENGVWKYYVDDVVDTSFTGLLKHIDGSWYYVASGVVDWSYTGLWKHTNGSWYYVEEGVLDWNFTGLWKHTNGSWYYVEKGKLNWGFTGAAEHTNGKSYFVTKGKIVWGLKGLHEGDDGVWYYLSDSTVKADYTGLLKHTDGSWYYVANGVVDWSYTGLWKHTNGYWFYVGEGILDWDFTGLVKHTNGSWYYVEEGELNWGFTGAVEHTNGKSYFVTKGKIVWGLKGLHKGDDGVWYYLSDSTVQTAYTGLVKHTNGGWYYVADGELDWSFTGLVKHNGYWFYVEKGKLNWGYTGLVEHINGKWYYVEDGEINWRFNGTVDGKNVVNGVATA